MADPDTSLAQQQDADALASQIERTREELARTIDSIADRVNPAKAARRAWARAREEVSRPDPRLVMGAAVVVVATAAYLIWRRRR